MWGWGGGWVCVCVPGLCVRMCVCGRAGVRPSRHQCWPHACTFRGEDADHKKLKDLIGELSDVIVDREVDTNAKLRVLLICTERAPSPSALKDRLIGCSISLSQL